MKRKLNLKGKVLVTTLTIMLSVFIYVLVAFTDIFSSGSIIAQAGLLFAWIWLYFIQFGVYALTWEK